MEEGQWQNSFALGVESNGVQYAACQAGNDDLSIQATTDHPDI